MIHRNRVFAYGSLVALAAWMIGMCCGAFIAKHNFDFMKEEHGQVIVRYEATFTDTQELMDRLAIAMSKFQADFAEIEHRRGNELYGVVRFEPPKETDDE